jgi:hypothetical protein
LQEEAQAAQPLADLLAKALLHRDILLSRVPAVEPNEVPEA